MVARKERLCSFCQCDIHIGEEYIAIGAYADYCLKHGKRRMVGVPKNDLDREDDVDLNSSI